MNRVFLDTVGLVGMWDRKDPWHPAALEAFLKLAKERRPLVTTTFILLECGNALARSPIRQSLVEFRRSLVSPHELVVPTGDDWETAWLAYERGGAGTAGIVDQTSFLVMRRLGITQAFTNDKHFAVAEFERLF